jgi:Domain of unknown function (DUF4190)
MTQSPPPDARFPAPTPPPYAPGPPPGFYGQPIPRRRTNGLAVASLVLGILWIYGVGAILALVFGYVSKRQIDQSNGTQSGRGLAIAGIVLGWIGVAGAVLAIAALSITFSSTKSIVPTQPRDDAAACLAERAAVESATEAFRASTGAYPRSTDDLVGNTFLRSRPEHYSVSGSTITARPPCT